MDKRKIFHIFSFWILIAFTKGCVFHTEDGQTTEAEGVRFIRVREDTSPGTEILHFRAYPRASVAIRGMERSNDHKYFRIREFNSTTVQIILDKSLDDLVDRDIPHNLLKFRIFCTGGSGQNEETSYMSVTVYVEDVNDHAPVFLNEPYVIEVDESTPPGTILFQGIQAFDRDKPNTPNSDVQVTLGQSENYSGGPYFVLESPHRPLLILKKPLDYDNGIREFRIPVIASDRGTPMRQSNTTLIVYVKDHDDLPPKFTEGVYRTKINEFYPLTGKPIRVPLYFTPPIMAVDQDSLNATLIYDIISGNERRLFRVNPTNAIIFLEKEIDLEEESLPGNTFVLQIEARQQDSPLKRALARVEIEVMDLNDNPPEFEVELYNISIVENLPSGFSVLQVNAIDKDQGENAEFYYNLAEENPSGAFLIDARTGWITVRDQSLLDRETRSSIEMIVQAIERVPPYDTDRPKDAGTVQVEITLLDSNDNTPQFENGNLYEFKINVNAAVGSIIGKVTAKDPDEGRNGMILYELQRPRGSGYIPFRLDSQTGTLYISGPLRRGRIALFIEASDQPTNPSERRFSLAVVTIEVHAEINEDAIGFIGSPYEFWVGSDVPVGTSIGQVRTTADYEGDGDVMYDLLHSYAEGVPFAIEERSGIVTVIRDLDDFDRIVYYFEAVANFQFPNKPKGRLIKRLSKSEKQITESGEVIEIDEGIVSDSEDVLVTNVTIHVVSPDDERGILMKGSNLNPIEFHIKENLPGALIGRLLYKNGIRNVEKLSHLKDIFGQSSRDDNIRQNRHINSKFQRNSTNFPAVSFADNRRRKTRDIVENSTAVTYITPSPLIDFMNSSTISGIRGFNPYSTRRMSTWRPKTVKESSTRRINSTEDHMETSSTTLVNRRRAPIRNNTAIDNGDLLKDKRHNSDKPVGLRFLIANQQDVINKITIMEDGTLMTLSGLDRETRDIYRLTIIAEYSKGFVSGAGIYQVNVYVDDVNDNPPVFDAEGYSGIIYENSKIGTEVILNRPVRASDADLGKNSEFSVNVAGEGRDLFTIELINNTNEFKSKLPLFESQERFDIEKNFIATQLMLFNSNSTIYSGPYYRVKFIGTKPLDREMENFYSLNLVAKDSGGLTSTVKLNVLVADVNDNAPVLDKIVVYKDSRMEIVQYTDDMEIYFIDRNPSDASSTERVIIHGSPRLVNVNHTDAQRTRRADLRRSRQKQSRKLRSSPLFNIMEDTLIGVPVLKIIATDDDMDKNSQIFYDIIKEEISSSNFNDNKLKMIRFFGIDRISGEIRVNRPLQANSQITLNITARDIGGLSDSTSIRFNVIDVNNHAPVFKKSWYTFDLQEGVYYDQSIDRIEATDEDYGANANITYKLESSEKIPFRISKKTGVLKVDGDLDREIKAQYEFFVVAIDGAEEGQRLTGSVEVEINVLDVNDNAPEFIGYDDIVVINQKREPEEIGRKLISEDSLNKIQLLTKVPFYKAYLSRNTVPGTFVKQITAIDKDCPGNGNGLVMFSLLHHRMPHLFEIDSRDGIITTISKFNRYNGYEHVNLTIVASDLGSPSKTSTAMLLVNLQGEHVLDDDEVENIFPHKYYEVEVLENNVYPMVILKLNVSAPFAKEIFKWSLIPEVEEEGYDKFAIESKSGTLSVLKSLDREVKDYYRLKIRADPVLRGARAFPTVTYPISGERIQGLQDKEIRVVVRVGDVNDNPPRFKSNGRPIVTVIPKNVNFGFEVTQVEAIDIDAGVNAEVRYKLLNEPFKLFAIDEKTGKIRVLGLIKEDQRVYGFDVKATDRAGDDNGQSSIVNVFVYVLDEYKQVRLVISGKPVEVEREVDKLTEALSMATGMDVRVRLLEPHIGGFEPATDAYIYAVDRKSNTIVNMEELQAAMSLLNMQNISISSSAQILELSDLGRYRSHNTSRSPTTAMSGTELISIILAVIVFAGGLATSLCVLCVRYKRRSFPPSETGLAYSIARVSSTLGTGHSKNTTTSTSSPNSKRSFHDDLVHHQRSQIFPAMKSITKGILTHYDDRPREYIDVPLPKSVVNSSLALMDHDASCLRFNQIHNIHSSSQPQDTSVQSHHSSGHDSGVGFIGHERSETPSDNLLRILRDGRTVGNAKCSCNRIDSNICCGGDSSDSYEDSLKNSDVNHSHQKLHSTTTSGTPGGAITTGILPVVSPSSGGNNKNHNGGFRRSIRSHRSRQGMRHSFSGVRDDLTQNSPRVMMRPRGNSFRNSMTDLEQRLRNLEQSFREPFVLNNSRC